MAVYTEIADEEVQAFAEEYDIGRVVACKGIAEGIENSNFLLVTEQGPFILTLYERRVRSGGPAVLRGADGSSRRPRHSVSDAGQGSRRPGAAQPRRPLGGDRHLPARDVAEAADGHALPGGGRGAGAPASGRRRLPLAPRQRSFGRRLAIALRRGGGAGQVRLPPISPPNCRASWRRLERRWPAALPAGVIHADLFPDNVFFEGERLSGLIDFYFACTDFLAYDVAVCLNAWCFENDGSFNVTKARRLVSGYDAVRAAGRRGTRGLPVLARGAAMRFLLTRLYDWLNTPKNALVTPKNPMEYLQKLRFHRGARGLGAYGLDAVDAG